PTGGLGVDRRGKTEIAEGILSVRIHAERDNGDRWRKTDKSFERLFQARQIATVSGADRQRQVQCCSEAWPGAGLRGMTGEVRIGAERITVERYVQHLGATIEDLLGPVAVMVVEVENGYTGPRLLHEMFGCDGGVVEETETPIHRMSSMVAGRSAETIDNVLTSQHQVGGGQGDVNRASRCFVRAGDDRRAGIEAPVAE